MTDLLTTLRAGVVLADGAMGSYLFSQTGRLSEANHVYEAFNRERPELITGIHLAYLQAGARCLKTNTFGANSLTLKQYGLQDQVSALNGAAVRVARQAIAKYQGSAPDTGGIFLLGSIGPAGTPITDPALLEEVYREQIAALTAAGVDALLLETFSSSTQLELLIDLIRSIATAPPVLALLTIPSSSSHSRSAFDPVGFVERMHAKGVPVTGVNCCAPWDAATFVEAVCGHAAVRSGELLLAAMPNGGGFQRIGNRFMSFVNPEYVGRLARSLVDRGVRLIGGCCEMHPPHIREMHNYLHARQAGERAGRLQPGASRLPPVARDEKRQNGRFTRKLQDGEFAVSVEVLPPRGTDRKVIDSRIDFIRRLCDSGLVDALDLTDGSRGIPLMPPGDFIHLIRRRLGWAERGEDALELIPHFTARDLNLMGIQSRLIGYHASGVHNVLFITGDPPKMSPTYPSSTAVFDLDSITMIRFAHTCLNAGVDFGGNPLGKESDPRTHFTIGSGFEPDAIDISRELDKLRQKVEQGADYIMTQPAFDPHRLAPLEKVRDRCAVLVGVMILSSLEHAQRMTQIPGVVVPEEILSRLAGYERVADQASAGLEVAAEQVRRVVRDGWDGLYLISPGGIGGVLNVLRAGLL